MRISSSSSSRNRSRRRRKTRRRQSSPGVMSCRFENPRDGLRDASVRCDLALEVLLAARRQAIVARPTIFLGFAPLAHDPALDKHPLESWIKRSLFDLQDLSGSLLD